MTEQLTDISNSLIEDKLLQLNDDENNDDEKKWIIVHQDIDPKKYNELLREIESLKSIILDIHHVVSVQSEGVDKVSNIISSTKNTIDKVNKELNDMKDAQISSSRFGCIKDYVFPVIGMISVNYPVFWLMGPKTGMIASTLSYMIWKFS